MKLPRLTPSQWRSLAAGALGLAVTVNSAWLQIAGTPGIHIPPVVTGVMQVVGLLVAMGSRSLNKRDSGTGTGVVGDPACPVAVAPLGPVTAAPVVIAPPALTGLMPSLITSLAPVGQMLLTAYAADLVARQHNQAASDATLQIDQAALLAAHARLDALKADALKTDTANAPVPAAVLVNAQSLPFTPETPAEAVSAPVAGIAAPDSTPTPTIGGTN